MSAEPWLPDLDAEKIRQAGVDNIFDSLQNAATRLEKTAQKHGELLAGRDNAAWAAASADLVSAKATFYQLNEAARRIFSAMAHENAADRGDV